jgi:iron complex transport system substrate-binding protein
MFKRHYMLFVGFLIIVGLLVGCGAKDEKINGATMSVSTQETEQQKTGESQQYEPVTVDNFGRTITFHEPPQRAVALLQQYAEVMLALELEDYLVGYSLVSEGTPPELEEKLNEIPILAERSPAKEIFLGVEPDFVIGSTVSFVESSIGTIGELEELSITPYVAGDGEKPETMDNMVYKEIKNFSRIFGVENLGDALIESMQSEINEITEQIGDVEEPLKVFYFLGEESGSARTTGGDTIRSHLIRLAGGENIFSDLTGSVIDVSWEEVIERNPDVIVLAHRGERTPESMREFILNNSSLQDIHAVQNEHFVSVPLASTTAGVRAPSAVETLVKGFYPERFE